MAFGFPAYHLEKRQGNFDIEKTKSILQKIAEEELNWMEMGYHSKALDYNTRFGTGMLQSERILIFVSEKEIKIHSSCFFPAQFLDFGKNKRNVTHFWEAFDKLDKDDFKKAKTDT